MGNKELIEKVNAGEVRVITSGQMIVTITTFLLTALVWFLISYTTFGTRLTTAEIQIQQLQVENAEKGKALDALLIIAQENRTTLNSMGRKLGIEIEPLDILKKK